MNSTMVTAIEHHSNQQRAQGPQYGAAGPTINTNPRGMKSPPLNSPNGLMSPGRSGGGGGGGGSGQTKKEKAAAAAAARSLSLQTKLSSGSQASSAMSESPRSALTSPSGAGVFSTLDRSGHGGPRGVKRSVEEIQSPAKVGHNSLLSRTALQVTAASTMDSSCVMLCARS